MSEAHPQHQMVREDFQQRALAKDQPAPSLGRIVKEKMEVDRAHTEEPETTSLGKPYSGTLGGGESMEEEDQEIPGVEILLPRWR